MNPSEVLAEVPVEGEDVTRWVTFTSFWGSISYLLACTSIVVAHRRQPVSLDARTAAVGMGLHVASFVAVGSLSAAGFAVARGERTTDLSERRIAGGELERTTVQQGLGAAVGSLVPLALAIGSMRVAENMLGRPAFRQDEINWPVAAATMVGASGLVSLAVAAITGWVARDAKQG